MSRHRKFGSNADLRTQGWKYCQFKVGRNVYDSVETDVGRRTGVRVKGAQCSLLCSPERIARLGVPICHTHENLYKEALKEAEDLRLALRAKYDPGPLPPIPEY